MVMSMSSMGVNGGRQALVTRDVKITILMGKTILTRPVTNSNP